MYTHDSKKVIEGWFEGHALSFERRKLVSCSAAIRWTSGVEGHVTLTNIVSYLLLIFRVLLLLSAACLSFNRGRHRVLLSGTHSLNLFDFERDPALA